MSVSIISFIHDLHLIRLTIVAFLITILSRSRFTYYRLLAAILLRIAWVPFIRSLSTNLQPQYLYKTPKMCYIPIGEASSIPFTFPRAGVWFRNKYRFQDKQRPLRMCAAPPRKTTACTCSEGIDLLLSQRVEDSVTHSECPACLAVRDLQPKGEHVKVSSHPKQVTIAPNHG